MPIWCHQVPYLKCDCISISRRNWCSTPALTNWDFLITLIATINLLFRSRAKYTSPNLPLPSGRPISKSFRVHCFGLMSATENAYERGNLYLDYERLTLQLQELTCAVSLHHETDFQLLHFLAWRGSVSSMTIKRRAYLDWRCLRWTCPVGFGSTRRPLFLLFFLFNCLSLTTKNDR